MTVMNRILRHTKKIAGLQGVRKRVHRGVPRGVPPQTLLVPPPPSVLSLLGGVQAGGVPVSPLAGLNNVCTPFNGTQ